MCILSRLLEQSASVGGAFGGFSIDDLSKLSEKQPAAHVRVKCVSGCDGARRSTDLPALVGRRAWNVGHGRVARGDMKPTVAFRLGAW